MFLDVLVMYVLLFYWYEELVIYEKLIVICLLFFVYFISKINFNYLGGIVGEVK